MYRHDDIAGRRPRPSCCTSCCITCQYHIDVVVDCFSGSSYASAYYVYLWAEVLDADGFDAFLEQGSCFDAETAAKVRKFIYSAGNSQDPADAYKAFRGREPAIGAMLKKKGLVSN